MHAPGPGWLYQHAACGLLLTREDGTVLQANQAFAAWVGGAPSTLEGRRFQEFLSVGGRIFHQTHWLPLMRMQGSVREVKLELLGPEGRRLSVLVNGVREERDGQCLHHLALFESVDRDRYEKQLLEARALAETALQEKTQAEAALLLAQAQLEQAYAEATKRASFAEQMVAIVSHDLKTPLSAISMASELLAKAANPARQARLASHIRQAAQRANRLVRDLLDFTSAKVGQGIHVAPQPQPLSPVVAQCVEELAVAFPQARLVYLTRDCASACFDSDRIQQVLTNLVANAVAYGTPGEPITLCTAHRAEGLEVSVHNAGAAIPPGIREGLFDPMVRGTQAGDIHSVGLGLYIVRKIIHAHGGQVSVSSEDGQGTTFRFTLGRL
ncbi:ATP-binding protein [Pseudomonas sp. NPDC007930]|uniref:PAS domain-containing sensor histidine kinase n=1 Tax=Pseudomonas sp. NPDC007930 TaxID=3364417 RepID=UPI0036E4AB45